MKYSVMAVSTLSTPAQQDQLAEAVLARVGSKPVWGTVGIGKGLSLDNRPQVGIEVRFNNKPDASDLFDFIKQRMNLIPVLSGIVTIHPCSHDEGISTPCIVEERYEKV